MSQARFTNRNTVQSSLPMLVSCWFCAKSDSTALQSHSRPGYAPVLGGRKFRLSQAGKVGGVLGCPSFAPFLGVPQQDAPHLDALHKGHQPVPCDLRSSDLRSILRALPGSSLWCPFCKIHFQFLFALTR